MASDTDNDRGSIRVLLADNHDVLRRALRGVIEQAAGLDVVGVVGTGTRLAGDLAEHAPDVLVLDLGMRGPTAIERVRVLRAETPGTAIVLTSMISDARVARDAVADGVSGYVLKDDADRDLVPAIRAAAAGERFISPSLT